MKCKHCDKPIKEFPLPGIANELSPGTYWAHVDRSETTVPIFCDPTRWDSKRAEPSLQYGRPAMPHEFYVDNSKRCPVCKNRVILFVDDTIMSHYRSPSETVCPASGKLYSRSYPLFIYIHAWERHESASEKMRDYLRGVWQSAGHATAVEV